MPVFDGVAMIALCHGVYVDPRMKVAGRDAVKRASGEAVSVITSYFGARNAASPAVVVCASEPCQLHFGGPTRRSHATLDPRPAVYLMDVGPRTRGTIVHEMVHVEISRRLGARAPDLPTWFDEGVAMFLGDNVDCSAVTSHPIDDLRRLRRGQEWQNFTNVPGQMTPSYCQARDEIAAWVAQHGKDALRDVIDAVAAGRTFEDVYGALAIPPAEGEALLDGRFALDENTSLKSVDATGRPHVAWLVGEAVWTGGHHGSGVEVAHGGYVRADDFRDLGLPDKPFSLSLWAKPLTDAHVLVHTARDASGAGGWCVPMLGFDAGAHLVAQLLFAPDPHSFLTATGPVLPLNKWAHLAVTWSAPDGVRLYVNGALVASAAPRSAAERHRLAPASPMDLFLGSENELEGWTQSIEHGDWEGVLDELHVYDYALTAEQVTADMRTP